VSCWLGEVLESRERTRWGRARTRERCARMAEALRVGLVGGWWLDCAGAGVVAALLCCVGSAGYVMLYR
jgi:hypothetical protein